MLSDAQIVEMVKSISKFLQVQKHNLRSDVWEQ